MRGWPWTVIEWSWVAVAAVWLVLAFFAKRTLERPERAWSLVSGIALLSVALVLRRNQALLYSPRGALGLVAVALVAVGLVVTIWARVTLGGNWSGAVVVKEGHELVESGPYRFVRHPIYTGLLTMYLGTVLEAAIPLGYAAFVVVAAVLWGKLRREEALMARHFPDAYPQYAARVRALIPYVL